MPITQNRKSIFAGRQWQLLGLLFVVALINYFDRQSLSVVAPRMQAELHLNDQGYAHIVTLFLFASSIAYAISGFISDALGTRKSMALFVSWWSLAEAATAFARSGLTLGIARFCLGMGEPGLWVAAPKAVGEAFDKRQRGLAVGIYTMGATVGAVIALPIIVAVTTHLPWRSIFLLDGLVGLLWVPIWFWVYRGLKTAAPQGAVETTAASTKEVLRRGATWKLMIARGMTDPVWYFFLFWFPKYLLTARHMPMVAVSRIAWMVYLGAGVGTLLGGFISGALVRRGMRVGIAYRWTMLAAAMVFPLSPLAALVPHAGKAIAIAALIALAHMAWLVTLTATMIELYPPAQIGKAVGLIAMGSGLGGMVSSEVIGYLVMHGGYTPIFFIMALLHPLAIALLWKVYLQRRSKTADIVPLTA